MNRWFLFGLLLAGAAPAGVSASDVASARAASAPPPAARAVEPAVHIDLARYFPSPADERASRTVLMARLDTFAAAPPPADGADLLARLREHDAILRALRRHDLYVYVRAERDRDDREDAAADDALAQAERRLDDALAHAIARMPMPAATLDALLAHDPALAPYRHLVDDLRRNAPHAPIDPRVAAELAQPALDRLQATYGALRREAARAARAVPAVAAGASSSPADERAAMQRVVAQRWQPWIDRGTAFAGVLLAIVDLDDGRARLEGFAGGAPERAYFRDHLTTALVERALAAVRGQEAWSRYAQVVAGRTDRFEPAPFTLAQALDHVRAAARPMGPRYAQAFADLLAPANGRVDLCDLPSCDDAGFSLGFAGSTSALFYGGFDGSADSVRALAHEAAHAVHREFMNGHQPIAAYHRGPAFLFESFAMFNHFLLLDELSRSAQDPAARAASARQFLDAAFNAVNGAARLADLEAAIHDGDHAGRLHDAADLDALTQARYAAYTPAALMTPETRASWTRNRLFYDDPMYEVNYLFAGLLALDYLQRREADPDGFPPRFVALLENGFDDEPDALLKRFLGIELDDVEGLARRDGAFLARRVEALQALYREADAVPR
jgi:oligoendopeptidase F